MIAFARLLLSVAVPASLFWYPIANIGGIGNVTMCDVVLVLLWGITLPRVFARKKISATDRRPLKILGWVLVLGVLAALGSSVSSGTVGPAQEFAAYMKRFGLAAIIPLALSNFSSDVLLRRSKN